MAGFDWVEEGRCAGKGSGRGIRRDADASLRWRRKGRRCVLRSAIIVIAGGGEIVYSRREYEKVLGGLRIG